MLISTHRLKFVIKVGRTNRGTGVISEKSSSLDVNELNYAMTLSARALEGN